MKKNNIVYMMDSLGNLWVDPDSLVTWLIIEKTDEKIWKKFTKSIVKEKLRSIRRKKQRLRMLWLGRVIKVMNTSNYA